MNFKLIPFCLLLLASLALGAARKPNIIVLLADDLGWHDLNCTGGTGYRTPNIDRLRNEGMLFTDAHAAAPICSASRAALLTGQSPARLQYEFVPKFTAGRQQGPWPMITPDFPTELPLATHTVASILKRSDYSTAFAGKWHLNRHLGHYLGWRPGHGPESFGFDHTIDSFGAHPYGYGKPAPSPVPGEAFPEDDLTDKAIEFLKRDEQRPFFLWFSFYHVHDPFHSRCTDRVAWHQKKLPENADTKRAHYAAMVETLDHEVGRILKTLDVSGKSNNTLVIFTSDNGGHPEVSNNGPLRGSKWNLYQGGLRVPLLVRWPGQVASGSTCTDTVIGLDLAATIIDAAGADTAVAIDGISLLPRLKGEVDPPSAHERTLIWHFPFHQPETRYEQTKREIGVNDFAISQTQPQSAIRSGSWKLIHHFESGRDELFDLRTDPSESNDLTKTHPERSTALRESLFSRLTASGARIPRPKP